MARSKDFDEQEVLTKAVNLFWLKGYNGTSMQDLVEELGISRSSLYDTYGDKHTLFIKALESYQNNNLGRFGEIINREATAQEIIRTLLEFITAELSNDSTHKGCFMVNAEVEVAPHDEKVNQLVCENDQQVENTFYLVIKKGQEKGEITNKQDARALARFIFNTVKGIRVTARSSNDCTIFKDIIDTAMSVFE